MSKIFEDNIDENIVTVSSLIDKAESFKEELKDYNTALAKLRGNEPLKDIEKDSRPAVKLLYEHYKVAEKNLNFLLGTFVEILDDNKGIF